VVSRRRLPDGGENRRPDDPAIVELLDSVREARTSLTIELSAAAGALEAGQPEVARDIVAATAEEMRRAATRSTSTALIDPPKPRRTRRRALLALPAVPLVGAIAMTAASALGGGSAPPSHHPPASAAPVTIAAVPPRTVITGVTTSGPDAHSGATTTLHRLERVMTHHPQAAQVLAVADDLHDQLTAMIANATNDPARLHVVRHLLTLEQQVLESVKVPGTQLALAASRAIARLLALVPITHTTASPQPSTSTKPTKPGPTTTTSVAPTSDASGPSSASSQAVATTRAPGAMSKNALFGRGLFNRP
jgi:hypothetical protein